MGKHAVRRYPSPKPPGYGMLEGGNTCLISAALQMLGTVGSAWGDVDEYRVPVCRILKELARFDSSDWVVRGAISLQPKEGLGKVEGAAKFAHHLIMNTGAEDRFAGVQMSGRLPIASTHGWVAGKYSDANYVRLPITTDTWNEQQLIATMCLIGETTYRIAIHVSRIGPKLLFVTLQQFDNRNRKIRHRDVTPAEIKLGGEIYTRISALRHGGPSLDSRHSWMPENALSRPLSMFITIASFSEWGDSYADFCVCLSI